MKMTHKTFIGASTDRMFAREGKQKELNKNRRKQAPSSIKRILYILLKGG